MIKARTGPKLVRLISAIFDFIRENVRSGVPYEIRTVGDRTSDIHILSPRNYSHYSLNTGDFTQCPQNEITENRRKVTNGTSPELVRLARIASAIFRRQRRRLPEPDSYLFHYPTRPGKRGRW